MIIDWLPHFTRDAEMRSKSTLFKQFLGVTYSTPVVSLAESMLFLGVFVDPKTKTDGQFPLQDI